MERVGRGRANPYGSTRPQRDEIARNTRAVEPLLRRGASVELDGRLPVGTLADRVERLLRR